MESDSDWIKVRDATGEILHRVPIIVLVANAEASIIYANHAVESVLGYRPDEVMGEGWWVLTRPSAEDRERARSFIKKSVLSGELPSTDPYEEKILTRFGETRYLLWRDVLGPHGTLIGVGEDVTERRKVDRELRRAKRQAEKAAVRQADFLANMSHEIRTPMNAVTGASSLLLDTSLDPKQKELVEVIRSSGLNLLGLVNDILDFSRIQSGALSLERRAFQMEDCVEEAISSVAYQAASKGVDLGFEIDRSLPEELVGDDTRIRQVMVNLLANAVKFTRSGWVFMEVKKGAELAGERTEVLVTVEDTGIGIAPEQAEHLFDPFAQAEASTSRRYGGTGLGLTISRRLCELMGGTIGFDSEKGKGSTFRFSFICNAPLPSEDNGLQMSSGIFVTAVFERRVLVHGLPEASRRVLMSWLERWRVKVVESAPADEIADLNLDLAVVRISRANRRGVALFRALESAGVPILGVMGLTEELAARRSKRLSGQLIVPLRSAEMERAVRGALGLPLIETKVEEEPSELPELADLRILLGEDNPVNQMIALMMLESLGLQAEVAGNGFEVLKALQREPFDVILMDVEMPELDGLETTRRIRNQLRSRVQIIAVTANAMQGDRQRCLEAGMDDYISKPFQVDVLHRVLGECRRLSDLSPARSAKTHSEAPDSGELCPFITRCPMFPLFENEPIRRVYQLTYCKGDYLECHRYNLASNGTMPDPRLLPDGGMLPSAPTVGKESGSKPE